MSFVKSCFLFTLFVTISFYLISLYDEATYQKLIRFTRTYSGSFSSNVPKWVWIYWKQVRTLIVGLIGTLVSLAQYSVIQLVEVYTAIMSDEKVQLYIESTKENFYILCIKVSDILIDGCDSFRKYVGSYLK